MDKIVSAGTVIRNLHIEIFYESIKGILDDKNPHEKLDAIYKQLKVTCARYASSKHTQGTFSLSGLHPSPSLEKKWGKEQVEQDEDTQLKSA